MRKIYIGNLSPDTREADIQALFSQHGKVRSIRLAADVFSGQCRGFGFVEMEGHEARAALRHNARCSRPAAQVARAAARARSKSGRGGELHEHSMSRRGQPMTDVEKRGSRRQGECCAHGPNRFQSGAVERIDV
jgi:RNA recognition motif-containing protein